VPHRDPQGLNLAFEVLDPSLFDVHAKGSGHVGAL
jgi:hypothetical protein